MEVIAPKIQGDGGWIEISSCEGSRVCLDLRGECSKCSVAVKCMDWVIQEVKKDLKMEITIEIERKKPFFWDA